MERNRFSSTTDSRFLIIPYPIPVTMAACSIRPDVSGAAKIVAALPKFKFTKNFTGTEFNFN